MPGGFSRDDPRGHLNGPRHEQRQVHGRPGRQQPHVPQLHAQQNHARQRTRDGQTPGDQHSTDDRRSPDRRKTSTPDIRIPRPSHRHHHRNSPAPEARSTRATERQLSSVVCVSLPCTSHQSRRNPLRVSYESLRIIKGKSPALSRRNFASQAPAISPPSLR